MCTVTVLRDPRRALVTMNRDERWSRAPERSPAVRVSSGGVRWIGPADGERGGTWIGASELGVAACLLNGYAPEDLELLGRDDVPSRGEIIPALLDRPPGDAVRWLEGGLDTSPYPSFTLLALTPEAGVELSWRRPRSIRRRPLPDGWSLASSSFWRTSEVLGWRRDRFRAWLEGGAAEVAGVPTFNLLEAPGLREWSPLMTRALSATRSVSQVDLRPGDGAVELRWWPRHGDGGVDPARTAAALRMDLADVPPRPGAPPS